MDIVDSRDSELVLELEEFFYDNSFTDYRAINNNQFFYDDSFEDYRKNKPNKSGFKEELELV